MHNIEQNTPEWLETRKNHIGASDAPIIMLSSPWKTPYQLWEEKIGIRENNVNAAMLRGHELEPLAREAYNLLTGNDVSPKVVFRADKPYMMASLDGLSKDAQTVVEIKCPGATDHQLAASGIVPEKYYAQLQHQLAVTNLKQLDYFSFSEKSSHIVKVLRDDEFIEKLMKKEEEFYKCMQTMSPPPLTGRDYMETYDTEYAEAAREWLEMARILKAFKEKEQIARERLIELSNNQNTRGFGVKCQKVVRKGTVDYTKIPELQKIDIEIYRKETIISWRISEC